MRTALLAAVCCLILPSFSFAADWTGKAIVVDGDTIALAGRQYARLKTTSEELSRTRDAALAAPMTAGGAGDDGAVLIAGAGHVRRDVAVPHHLARLDPAASVLAIAFVEVDGAVTDPAAYRAGEAGDPSPFDLLWFTPRWSDEDHCAVLRERLGKGAG